jgi:hypothetical protein
MANSEGAFEWQRIDDRQNVVGEAVPLKRAIVRGGGVAVGTKIDRPSMESREPNCQWFPNSAVKSGGMSKE